MDLLEDASVHLVVTSPPYWTLKDYPTHEDQLGSIEDYKAFHEELNGVWKECFRLLVPGGRLCVVVGDVCLSRKRAGRHRVVPLHADITVNCVGIGFDHLAPIIWYKIANVQTEMERGSYFLGKPYEPNAVIKHDIEYILSFRKPGGYRHPTPHQRKASKLTREEYDEWFRQVWTIRGEPQKNHPAPFPLQVAYRLIRMFSFVGDTVLDPFLGSGTTTLAAIRAGRSSVGYEIEEMYLGQLKKKFQQEEMLKDYEVEFTQAT